MAYEKSHHEPRVNGKKISVIVCGTGSSGIDGDKQHGITTSAASPSATLQKAVVDRNLRAKVDANSRPPCLSWRVVVASDTGSMDRRQATLTVPEVDTSARISTYFRTTNPPVLCTMRPEFLLAVRRNRQVYLA